MWDIPADAYCITTNGFVKKNGEAVMGAGCAKEAALKWPSLPSNLGANLQLFGNKVFDFEFGNTTLFTFPVKHNWWERASPDLIKRSAEELMTFVEHHHLSKVLLPRPGCGNGRLSWTTVAPLLTPILDERIFIVSK